MYNNSCFPVFQPPRPPSQCRDDASLRVRLFEPCGRCGCEQSCAPLTPVAAPITITNPWNCRDKATVVLSVDSCGNLVVCVKRGC